MVVKKPDKKSITKYEKSLKRYKSVKVPLKLIVKNEAVLQSIESNVFRMNQIVIHSYQFLKLYCIDQFAKTNLVPCIDYKFIMLIMKTVSVSNNERGKYGSETQILKDRLDDFYLETYQPLTGKSEQPVYTGLIQMLDYEAKSMVTCLSNHIMLNFSTLLNRYINIIFDKQRIVDKIKSTCDKSDKKIQINQINTQIRKVKNDIINHENKSDPIYRDTIDRVRKNVLIVDSDDKKVKSFNLIAVSDPLSLLPGLIRMSVEGEKIMASRTLKKPKLERKLFNIINCFPQRSNIVPKHCTFDSPLIVNTLMTENKRHYSLNIKKYYDEIWDMFFRTGGSMFRKSGYTFDHQITTDGVACTLLFIRNDLYDPVKKISVRHVRKPYNYQGIQYVQDLTDSEKSKIAFKTIVGIDPGVDDLLFATNGDTKMIKKKNGKTSHQTTTFRYSRMQRRKETKSRKFAEIIENDKKATIIGKETVKDIETKLSKVNFNSCIFANVKKNILLKNQTNRKLTEYYEKSMYRRLKMSGYVNRMRSESNMLNRFKEKFGDPKDVLIFIGDWSTGKGMRYKEPTKGKGFRDLFKKNGYMIYLVDEYNTSKRMFESGDEMERFKKVVKKDKEGKTLERVLVHGLIRNKLTNKIPGAKTALMNRDLNGSLNIRHKGIRLFYNASIPEYLSRKVKKIDVLIADKKKRKITVTKKAAVKKIQRKRKVIKNVQVANT